MTRRSAGKNMEVQGDLSSRYEMLYPLEGGPGVRVYLVRDHWEGDPEKVFTLLLDVGDPLDFERRYDWRLSLDHPNLVRLYDLTFRGSQLGLVSEFLPENLSRRARPFPPEEACRICWELTNLLQYLHRREVWCGSLTPAKLFCGEDGHLKLNLLLSSFSPEQRRASPEAIRYAAPELLTEGTKNAATDFYTLGMVLYFIFTGNPPFVEADPEDLRAKQVVAFPSAPRKLNPDIPQRIEKLILALIQKDPSLRPSSLDYVKAVLAENLPDLSQVSLTPSFRSPRVGRQQECSLFSKVLEDYRRKPRTRGIAVGGASGIGKSRLLTSFQTIAKAAGFETITVEHQRNQPVLAAFRQLVPKLGKKFGEPGAVSLDGEEGSERFVQGLVSFFTDSGTRRPIVLLIDDLQWMDEGSFEVYSRLVTVDGPGLILAGSFRTDEAPGLWESLRRKMEGRLLLTVVDLQPFHSRDLPALIGHLLGEQPSQQFIEELTGRCGGNPFYLYEFCRYLRQTGHLSWEDGRWRGGGIHPLKADIPHSVARNLECRVSALSPSQREILQLLSLLYVPAEVDLLEELLGLDRTELVGTLEYLQQLDFLQSSGILQESPLSLTHSWLGEVLRKTISSTCMRQLNQKIVRSLESRYFQRPDPYLLEALARHSLSGAPRSKARGYLWKAVDVLEQNRFYHQAAELLHAAIGLQVVSRKDWKVLVKVIELEYLAGRLERSVQWIREGLGQRSLTSARRFFLLGFLGRVYTLQGQVSQAIEALEQALLLSDFCDRQKRGEVLAELLCSLSLKGDLARAETIAGELTHGLQQGYYVSCLDKVHHSFFLYLLERGRLSEARRHELTAISLSLDSFRNRLRFFGRLFNMAQMYLDAGYISRVIRVSQYIQEAARVLDNWNLIILSRIALLAVNRRSGLGRETIKGLRQLAVENEQFCASPYLTAEIGVELAKNLIHAGQPDNAIEILRNVLSLSTAREVLSCRIDALLALGWSWLMLGDLARAEETLITLESESCRRQRSRFLLLTGSLRLAQKEYEKAWEAAEQALACLSGRMPYYRTRVRLLQAEILVEQPELGKPAPFVAEALKLAREHFYLPLMAQGHLMAARCSLLEKKPRPARVQLLRALQIMNHVERPLLRVEILKNLARVYVQMGERSRAMDSYQEALQIVAERAMEQKEEHRKMFLQTHTQPLEEELGRLFEHSHPSAPRFLVQVRQYAEAVRTVNSVVDGGRELLAAIKAALPNLSAQFYFRDDERSPFRLVAALGKCRRSGRPLLAAGRRRNKLHLVVGDPSGPPRSYRSVGIRLYSQDEFLALLYVESRGPGMTETEVDFLECLAGIVQTVLDRHDRVPEPAAEPEGLPLKGGRIILSRDPQMQRLFEEIRRVAPTETTVLIQGESGTGKELVARALHDYSRRQSGPFLPLNCAALPADLIENELFGHTEGSYTGAVKSRRGLFEAASGGTLFLDEVGAMSPQLQARLLRVLQDRKIRRIGETQERCVDVRVVAASNQNLRNLVQTGLFREDLYHRLNVCPLYIPPLRERSGDVPRLARFFVHRLCEQEGRKVRITTEATKRLEEYPYPGNVRELENMVESLFYLNQQGVIRGEDVSQWIARLNAPSGTADSRAQRLFEALIRGEADFWTDVRDPFLNRDLSRAEVRQIIALGLEASCGSYRRLAQNFRLSRRDYKKLMSFLSHHDCKVDFRPYRKGVV